MVCRTLALVVLCAAAMSGADRATGQSTIGAGSTIVIPVVANTATFTTEVWIRNHNPSFPNTPLTVNVKYYGALGTVAPGLQTCSQVVVPTNRQVSFTLATQCTLPPGSNFGLLVLEDAAAEKINTFYAYSRTQNFAAIGFSVEGYPIGALSYSSQLALGLKRIAGPTAFQTNCFVAALAKPVSYEIVLRNGSSNAQIGSLVTGSLQPYEMIRYLDIFSAAAAPAGDHTNVTARFAQTNPFSAGNFEAPLFVGFCTVQDNSSFGADIRVGKTLQASDYTQSRSLLGCTPARGCPYDQAIADVTRKDVYQFIVRPPDHVKCQLNSDRLAELEMRLRAPDYPGQGAPVAGGDNQTSFYHVTGSDIARPTDGFPLRSFWTLEVSAREIVPAPVTPIPYSIDCYSGNGVSFWTPTSAPDDF